MQIVSITSQGQITIPAKLRRELGLDKYQKAFIKREGERVVVEPVEDLLSLEGSLHHKAIKGKSIQEIMKLEEKAWEEGALERYKRSLGR